MAISFTCPHCGERSKVAPEYAGLTGPCSRCGEQITIPGQPSRTGMTPQYEPPEPSGRRFGCGSFLVLVWCVLVCSGLLMLVTGKSRSSRQIVECGQKLRQIGLGMQDYSNT